MTRIRAATAADADRIGDVHDAAVREHGSTAYDDAQVEAWAGGDEGATPEDDDHWIVAEREDPDASDPGGGAETTIVGWGRIDVETTEISGSYVHPDHARSGVGSTIIAALEGYARGRGLEEVTLLASKNAVGFYERLGYEGVESVAHESGDEVILECLAMGKSL